MAALMSALKALPTAMKMASAARSAMPAVKAAAPTAMGIARQGLQALPQATQKLAKSAPPFAGALGALSRAAPHVGAMAQKPGLSTLFHGIQALRELRGATRELSKMGKPAGGTDAKPGGQLKVMVGRPQKNWEEATAKNGFRELGAARGGKGSAKQGDSTGPRAHGIKIMVGRPQKNWEEATAKNGFRELGGGKSKQKGAQATASGARAQNFKIMLGRPKKNWEEATAENGFRELGGRKSPAAAQKGARGGPQIQLSFVRGAQSSSPGAQRVGGLSIALPGFAQASHSRQRANAFDGTQRKHGGNHSFPDLSAHTASKARQRAHSTPAARSTASLSMTIGFSLPGFAAPTASPRSQGRARAHTI